VRHFLANRGYLHFLIAGLLVIAGAQLSIAQTSSVLAPGDVVRISVYGNPDLTTVTRVAPDGTISFPLIGKIAVGGISVFDAEQNLAAKLRQGGFVTNAAVTIFVQERSAALTTSVTLLGQVAHSGTYSLDQESAEGVSNLIELLARAGGGTEKAADYCFLIRKENGQPRKRRIDLVDLLRNGNIEANITLNDGDIVLVPEMEVFYIYGEVQRPGRYRLERDMTVMQALAVASGMTPRGNAKGIELNRQGNGELKSDLDDRLQNNDVVYVRTAVF
jgi:polysaccharide export outer membrane protein